MVYKKHQNIIIFSTCCTFYVTQDIFYLRWVYTPASQTLSLSYSGTISTYEGGGFYQDLTDSRNQTAEIIKNLKEGLWITRGTRAIFIDFTVYNANLNLFVICK